jgi:hypothetical protein
MMSPLLKIYAFRYTLAGVKTCSKTDMRVSILQLTNERPQACMQAAQRDRSQLLQPV